MATHAKTKQNFNEAVYKSVNNDKKGVKYTQDYMKTHMGIGGGQPIPRGHKMTNEKRRLQPRDPEGHFTYNADAGLGLIDRPHGKGDAIPVSVRALGLNVDIKKGDVLNIGGKTWTAIEDISFKAVINYFSHFDTEKGEYYSEDEYGDKTALSGEFEKKKGRTSSSEKEGISRGAIIVGSGANVIREFNETANEYQVGASQLSGDIVGLDPNSAQYRSNEEYNNWADKISFNPNTPTVRTPNTAGASAPQMEEEELPPTDKNAPSALTGMNPPKGLFSENGNFDGKTINYRNPAHKKFFDDWSKEIRENPKRWGISEADTKKINGQVLAYLASKGKFDGKIKK